MIDYEENEKFRRFVDLYCLKHGISVLEALDHVVVQEYKKMLDEKDEKK